MKLKEYLLGSVTQFAPLVFVRVMREIPPGLSKDELKVGNYHIPVGYVLVFDPKYGASAKFKMPAGHATDVDMAKDDPPLATAVRETDGETGLSIPPDAFKYVGKYLSWNASHWKILFMATITERDRDWMNNHHPENEGEMPKFFTVDEFYEAVRAGKVLREHFEKLVEFDVILPLGREKVQAVG